MILKGKTHRVKLNLLTELQIENEYMRSWSVLLQVNMVIKDQLYIKSNAIC